MSTKHVRSMRDFFRHGMDIALECECGRKDVLPYLPVLLEFNRRGWSMGLASALRRFRCSACGARPVHIGPHYR